MSVPLKNVIVKGNRSGLFSRIRFMSSSTTPTKFVMTRTITREDLDVYGDLTDDKNPVHFNGDNSIVHGTLLLGLVSGVMGTKCPGPGTKVIDLTAQFKNPCPVNETVSVQVELTNPERKIKKADYLVKSENSDVIFVQGTAKLI